MKKCGNSNSISNNLLHAFDASVVALGKILSYPLRRVLSGADVSSRSDCGNLSNCVNELVDRKL